MSLYCDNYATCNEVLINYSDSMKMEEHRARIKGWRVWEGDTMGGKHTRVVLGPHCVGAHRMPDRYLPPLQPGDQTMIQFEVEVGEEDGNAEAR